MRIYSTTADAESTDSIKHSKGARNTQHVIVAQRNKQSWQIKHIVKQSERSNQC